MSRLTLSRREFGLFLGATGLLAGCGPRRVQVALAIAPDLVNGVGSLKVHAAEQGLYYGCGVEIASLASDAEYAALVRAQAGMIVAEDAMTWEALRPADGQFRWKDADALVAFAETNGMKVRGRCLCACGELPAWVAGMATKRGARALLEEHIARVAGRYMGRMHSWDVVNEVVRVEDGRADGLRASPWLRLVGEDYVEVAFHAARTADPEALLTYSECGLTGEDANSQRKRVAVLTLLRRLKARGVPVDALGMEAELGTNNRFGAGLMELLAAVRELGLQVFVTRLQVNDRALPMGDAAVAQVYGSFLGLVLREPAVKIVMTRGIMPLRKTDLEADGGLPFDGGGNPVAAFYAMRGAFDERRRWSGNAL